MVNKVKLESKRPFKKTLNTAMLILLILNSAFLAFVVSASWGWHLLSYAFGDWHFIQEANEIRSFRAVMQNQYEIMRITGDVSGVTKVFIVESEPEFSVYFNEQDQVVATRIGYASVLSRVSVLELSFMFMMLFLSIVFFTNRANNASELFRFFAPLLTSHFLVSISGYFFSHFFLHLAGVVIGLITLLLGLISGLLAMSNAWSYVTNID